MKYHKSLVKAISEALQLIFEDNKQADFIVSQTLKTNKKWGSRDRKFIAENIYEVVRWKILYEYCIGYNTSETTDYYSTIFAVSQILQQKELPDWDQFKLIDKKLILENFEKAKTIRHIIQSIPEWLDKLCAKELGEIKWTNEIQALNEQAPLVIRINTLKSSKNELEKELYKIGAVFNELKSNSKIYDNLKYTALICNRFNLIQTTHYKNGLFEIQDASSQLVAEFLNPISGTIVIDACAGAGGKTLHLASLMKNKGKIIAMDVEENKLKELKIRANRAGASIIQTKRISNDTIFSLNNTADFVLLDVPCSGLGVLKRNPDAKWKLSLDFIEEIKKTQAYILTTYSSMVKQGGTLVYATCSILPSENENQVYTFINNNSQEFEMIEERKILPSMGFDGFYMAKLKRKIN